MRHPTDPPPPWSDPGPGVWQGPPRPAPGRDQCGSHAATLRIHPPVVRPRARCPARFRANPPVTVAPASLAVMRLATWNINSIRSRADRALAFLERSGTDVLALQETKCKDEQFPREVFEAAGYEVATSGYSQWNGVAIVSRVGIADVERGF